MLYNNISIDVRNEDQPEVDLRPDLINDDTMYFLRLILMYVLQIIIQTFGIVTNGLSIITFVKCGLNDSVSVSLLALSISDIFYVSIFLIVRVVGVLDYVFHVDFIMRLTTLAYILSLYAVFFQDAGALVTVFTGIQKCCCVAMPHLFKNVFTVTRALITIGVIFVSVLVCYIPVFSSFGFRYHFMATTNQTRLIAYRTSHYVPAMLFWKVASRIVLVLTSQIILLICLVIMASKFKASAKFRKLQNSCEANENQNKKDMYSNTVSLGRKESRALTAVIIVCAMYVSSTLPATVSYIFRSFYPPYEEKYMYNVRVLVNNGQTILISLSASSNFFVYFNYNSKFKRTLFTLFKKSSGTSDDE